ncbi:hypothetical protein TNCV_1814721 [Trichonephila clavipes]|nr:hypothetical protein TNCV_1814721 [Trichonephila clavipes]
MVSPPMETLEILSKLWRDYPRFTNRIVVFKEGREAIEDSYRVGQTSTSWKAENVAMVSECVQKDRLQTLSQIYSNIYTILLTENAMANAFWVSVRNNISKRWSTTENDVSKNQSSADSAIRLPNTSTLNSNAADITEYFLDVYRTTLY